MMGNYALERSELRLSGHCAGAGNHYAPAGASWRRREAAQRDR
jgi:hypothetical protein